MPPYPNGPVGQIRQSHVVLVGGVVIGLVILFQFISNVPWVSKSDVAEFKLVQQDIRQRLESSQAELRGRIDRIDSTQQNRGERVTALESRSTQFDQSISGLRAELRDSLLRLEQEVISLRKEVQDQHRRWMEEQPRRGTTR